MIKPLNHILIKPAGPDCTMACGYCFYRSKTGLFPETPRHRMEDAVLGEMVRQVMAQGPAEVSFGWQGGEPTLMGSDFFERAVEYQRRYGQGKTVGNGIQTNGILLDKTWADLLHRNRFPRGPFPRRSRSMSTISTAAWPAEALRGAGSSTRRSSCLTMASP